MVNLRNCDKRDRLIEAARSLFRKQGYGETSLSDIARKSAIPVGNVYYYFKTKDEIAAAVIKEYAAGLGRIAESAERLPSGKERIIAMLTDLEQDSESIADCGCPMGSLCIEFGKRRTPLTEKANRLLLNIVQWVEQQLKEMGRDDAHTLAIQLVSTIQGAGILALAMHDPEVLRTEMSRLKTLVRAL